MMREIIELILSSKEQGNGFKNVQRDSRAAHRSMTDLGKAAQKLGGEFGKLGGLMGSAFKAFLGGGIFEVAAEGIRALINLYQKSKEKAAEAAEAMKKAADEAAQARVKATAGEVDALAENWQKTEKAVSAVVGAENALKAAQDEYTRAVREGNAIRVDAAEKTALAALAPGDKAGAERVKAHYAQLRETMKADQTSEDALVAYSRAGNAEGAARATLARRQGALSDAESKRLALQAQIADATNKDEITGLQDQLAKLDRNIEALTDSVRKAENDLAVAQIRAKTADVRFQSSVSNQELSKLKNAETANAAENAAWEKKRQELQQSLQNSISFLTGYSGAVRGTAGVAPVRSAYGANDGGLYHAARTAYDKRLAPADRADRLARSAQGALDTLSKVDAEALVQVFDRLKAQANRLSRDIELIKQREAKK